MRLVALAAAILIAGELQAAAGQAPADTPIVQVGLFGYRADGTQSSIAYDTSPRSTRSSTSVQVDRSAA